MINAERHMTETDGQNKRARRKIKDRVLQARIPKDLDEELRGRADQLGLSVSTIVRNVLLHTFDLVEGVVSDSVELTRIVQGRGTLSSQKTLPPPDAIEPDEDVAIIGWQEAILNRNGICDQCNVILAKGERASVGVPTQRRPVLLCLECLAALSSVDPDSAQ